jgi:beta-lactam-binding protein with PASTA domain
MRITSRSRKNRRQRDGAGLSPTARRGLLRGLSVIAMVLAGWGIGYGVATLVMFPRPQLPSTFVEIPDLRQRDLDGAQAELTDVGLVAAELEFLRHPQIDSGRIVAQAPLPGQLALPGESVHLVASLGPDRRPVPDVTRLRGDRAAELLRASGFEVQVDSLESDQPRGRVLELEPAEGTEVALPAAVRLALSLGPPVVDMPDLKGFDIAQARDSLQALGLVVGTVDEVFRFGRDQGRVVDQQPVPATRLQRGSAVRLTVGRQGG